MPSEETGGRFSELGPVAHELLETLPGGVAFVKPDGSISWANGEALRVLGLSYDELTRRYTRDFDPYTIYEDGSPCPVADYPVTRALASAQPQRPLTLGVRGPDGRVSWAVFTALPVLDPETGRIKGALVTFLDITERKRVEEELSRSRDLLRAAQKIANVGSWEFDLETGRVLWTEQMYQIHGISEDDFTGHARDALRFIHPEDAAAVRALTEQALTERVPQSAEYRLVRPDGSVRVIWGDGQVVHDEHGRATKMVGAIQDVTERRALEEQLRQSHRMESIGRLAGGIAHDFNNLLQVILGNADIALRDPTKQTALIEIKMAAQRAAELTRQLLAFGRRQPFAPVELDLNELVRELTPLLRRMLGERVGVDFTHDPAMTAVCADRGQLEQVLINLCINARDAMPAGGRIEIRTALREVDAAFKASHPWAEAPRYALLQVKDSGQGMSAEVSARAFEPFFTTKDPGAGTGLGLAVAYGIAQQHRGAIALESEPGGGTIIDVYLPAEDHVPEPRSRPPEPPAPGGDETLLVVEDEVMVQKLVVSVLKSAGYKVLSATDGSDALQKFQAHREQVALVLVDLVMPGMSGRELGQHVHDIRPELPVLYTTGYAADPVDIAELGDEPVLYKPYERAALLHEIRKLLDA